MFLCICEGVPIVLIAQVVVTLSPQERQQLPFSQTKQGMKLRQRKQRKCTIWRVAFVAGRPEMLALKIKVLVSCYQGFINSIPTHLFYHAPNFDLKLDKTVFIQTPSFFFNLALR